MSSKTPSECGDKLDQVYEVVTEEIDESGARLEKRDKVTVRHYVEEVYRPKLVRSPETGGGHILSRPTSEEFLDSSYYTHNGTLSKSSSQQSVDQLRKSLSKEALDWDQSSVGSGAGSSRGGEWYQEYRNQSFQNINSKLERILTRQEYDTHIAEIKGKAVQSTRLF